MVLSQGKEYMVSLDIRSPEFDIEEGKVDAILAEALNDSRLELVDSFPYQEEEAQ